MVALLNGATDQSKSTWQEDFLKMLPRIKRQAQIAFQNLDPGERDEAVTEVVATAMCAYKKLHDSDELHKAFASALTRFAVLQYRDGRRCGTSQNSRDVYSALAKRKAGFDVQPLGAPGEQVGEWMECLHDNRVTSVPNQAAFRIDFPCWLNKLDQRERRIAERLSLGYSTTEVSDEFDVSRGRISQLRRKLSDSWFEFINGCCSESNEDELPCYGSHPSDVS